MSSPNRIDVSLSQSREQATRHPNHLRPEWPDEEEKRWRGWAAKKFPDRVYLAIQAAESPNEAQMAVDMVLAARMIPKDSIRAVVVAALDGAAEFSRACARVHQYNGAENEVEKKDAEFYELAGYVLKCWGGVLVESGLGDNRDPAPDARVFQDAGVAVFTGEYDAVDAIAAGHELHRTLARHNHGHAYPWPRQMHSRVCVGRTFEDVLLCLRNTHRGNTVVAGNLWDAMDHNCQRLLLAMGTRRGRNSTPMPVEGEPPNHACSPVGGAKSD